MTAALCVFLPLLGAALAGLFGRGLGRRGANIAACAPMAASAFCGAVVFAQAVAGREPYSVELFRWMRSGTLDFSWALYVDPLSALMMFAVSAVSALVHVYSIGYMAHDAHAPRFMAYLSLFTFAMLMLVTADNFVQLYFGWEGVGLCSYLLIGFWYTRPAANAAAIKAFIVNRVGDFGFALGIFAIYLVFDSVDYSAVFGSAAAHAGDTVGFLGVEGHALTLICLLLFIGAMGKSAQLFLHTWLPDAMEGPTPVSALIHAATMVTAGVFMVARCSPLFEHSATALSAVAIVGAATAFFAATVALAQNDIKRVIAYSTCSQLGYMFFACGVSAYAAGVFHLLTHAFFKALLFLGAGAVIHALSDEQDMRRMGGLARAVPWTCAFMWIGSLALAGIPPFAGFYSKDIILEAAWAAHGAAGAWAFWLGMAAAVMTAFYSWRLLFMTFHGAPRAGEAAMARVHEAPPVMLLPLAALAAGAVAAGYVGRGLVDPGGAYWGGALTVLEGHDALAEAHHAPFWVKAFAPALAVAGIAVAWAFYIYRPHWPGRVAAAAPGLHRFLLRKWYFDELYERLFVAPARRLGRALWKTVDGEVIDGVGPNGVAAAVAKLARRASRLQTGYVYHYAFAMLIGVAALATWYLGVGAG